MNRCRTALSFSRPRLGALVLTALCAAGPLAIAPAAAQGTVQGSMSGMRNFPEKALARRSGQAPAAGSAEDGQVLVSAHRYDLVILDITLPGKSGLVWLRELARDSGPDAVIELIRQACLTYDVESQRVRRLVETELNCPYLRIETDYSPSDSARIALRIEALFETVKARKHSTP